MNYNVKKSGRAFNGAHRDAGSIVHIVTEKVSGDWFTKALCGTEPGYAGNGWSETNDPATCQACIKNSSVIRTIGLHQPYAGLMLHGKIETRWVIVGKKAPFPIGKYMIYATGTMYTRKQISNVSGDQYDHVLEYACSLFTDPKEFQCSQPLCLADLVLVRDMTELDSKLAFVQYRPPYRDDKGKTRRLVALSFTNHQRIEPFPFKGKQGVGFLTAEQKQLIKIV